MKTLNVRGLMETATTKVRSMYATVRETVGNKFVRSPETDLLVKQKLTPIQAKLNKQLSQFGIEAKCKREIASSAKTPEEAEFKFDFSKKLHELFHEDSDYDLIALLAKHVESPEQAEFQYGLAKGLKGVPSFDYDVHTYSFLPRYDGMQISLIASTAKTKEQAMVGYKMAVEIPTKDQSVKFGAWDVVELMNLIDTPEKALHVNTRLDKGVHPFDIVYALEKPKDLGHPDFVLKA